MKKEKVKKATNGKVRALIEERKKRAIERKKNKKLRVSDIKHGQGAQVNHLLNRIRAREAQLTFICVTIVLLVILIILYFVFSSVRNPVHYSTIKVGDLEVTFNDRGKNLGSIVDLTPVHPMGIEEGQNIQPYKIKIVNTSSTNETFQIKFMKDVAMVQEDHCNDIQLPEEYIRYQINTYDSQMLDANKLSPVIYTETLDGGEVKFIEVRLWVDDILPNEYIDYHYHGKLVVKTIKTAE